MRLGADTDRWKHGLFLYITREAVRFLCESTQKAGDEHYGYHTLFFTHAQRHDQVNEGGIVWEYEDRWVHLV